jgi:RNA polymerase sigma-70 factor (ECF subfamily)
VDSPLDQLDDGALVRACQAGRREAFDVLVRRHQRQLYQLCHRFTGSHDEASDLTQDVFVRAYRALPGFKGQSALTTWLYRIGVNVCLNRASLKTPRLEPIEAVERADGSVEPADEALMREQTARRVRRAIARLPPKQRATVILRAYLELPHEEIASILGSSVGAVKANFFHALAGLRRTLGEP